MTDDKRTAHVEALRQHLARETGQVLPQRELAARSGLSQSVISRQLSGTQVLAAETVVGICRGVGASVLGGLVAAGVLDAAEAGGEAAPVLENVSAAAMLRELLRREG
ncbi:hypothetical protein C5E10_05265 [Pseudoclavibacter sp. RFBG4]|uniref:hypothetical protein n=1 Tax=Pseudoclavibacter sp. RFBG4 TaxID=2080575 RepID=UPI000CE8C412|nr:hypothetical protein [Pseudoclavibacter sp. RFBG4]PPG35013.1 hypothetical protein C5E10_05265 [Pseudoclavibacter sp. RFBG4]